MSNLSNRWLSNRWLSNRWLSVEEAEKLATSSFEDLDESASELVPPYPSRFIDMGFNKKQGSFPSKYLEKK